MLAIEAAIAEVEHMRLALAGRLTLRALAHLIGDTVFAVRTVLETLAEPDFGFDALWAEFKQNVASARRRRRVAFKIWEECRSAVYLAQMALHLRDRCPWCTHLVAY